MSSSTTPMFLAVLWTTDERRTRRHLAYLEQVLVNRFSATGGEDAADEIVRVRYFGSSVLGYYQFEPLVWAVGMIVVSVLNSGLLNKP